jgi:hypothetical protein
MSIEQTLEMTSHPSAQRWDVTSRVCDVARYLVREIPRPSAELGKANVRGVLPKALTAHVEPVLPDQTSLVRAHPALAGSLSVVLRVGVPHRVVTHLDCLIRFHHRAVLIALAVRASGRARERGSRVVRVCGIVRVCAVVRVCGIVRVCVCAASSVCVPGKEVARNGGESRGSFGSLASQPMPGHIPTKPAGLPGSTCTGIHQRI